MATINNNLQKTCIKCEKYINTTQSYKVRELNVDAIAIINDWISPQIINDTDDICEFCWKLALEIVKIKKEVISMNNEETNTNNLDVDPLKIKTEPHNSDDEEIINNKVEIAHTVKVEEYSCNQTKSNDLIDSLNTNYDDTENSHQGDNITTMKEQLHNECDEEVGNNSHNNATTYLEEEYIEPHNSDDEEINNKVEIAHIVEVMEYSCNQTESNNMIDPLNTNHGDTENSNQGDDTISVTEQPLNECDEEIENSSHNDETTYLEEEYLESEDENTISDDKDQNYTITDEAKKEQALRNGCAMCGRSILRRKQHFISPLNEKNKHIAVTAQKLATRPINEYDGVCDRCWKRAYRAIKQESMEKAQNTSLENENTCLMNENPVIANEDLNKITDPECSHSDPDWTPPISINITDTNNTNFKPKRPSIKLHHYKRAAGSRGCIFYGCQEKCCHRLSTSLRTNLLINYNFYVPNNARICEFHEISNNWDILYDGRNSMSKFTAEHIEDLYSLLTMSRPNTRLNFNDVLTIDENLLKYLIGIPKEKFVDLIDEIPELHDIHRGLTGLTALLIKRHQGATNESMSSLMRIPRRTLEVLMMKVTEGLAKRGHILDAFLPPANNITPMQSAKKRKIEPKTKHKK